MEFKFPDGTHVSTNIPGLEVTPVGFTMSDAIHLTKKEFADHLKEAKLNNKAHIDPYEARIAALEAAVDKLTPKPIKL